MFNISYDLYTFINSTGLICDITGVALLFFYSPPAFTILKSGDEILPFKVTKPDWKKSNLKKYRINSLMSKAGLILLITGFTFQLVSNLLYRGQ